jgi:hypothetical protein
MSTLAGSGTISYNGFAFPGPRVSTGISMVAEYDSSGRSVIGWRHTLRVEAYLTGDDMSQASQTGESYRPDPVGDPNDTLSAPGSVNYVVENAKRLLGQAGGALVFKHQGFGEQFEINTAGSDRRDLMWGPKPKSMSWKQLGPGMAWHLTYEIEFMLARCKTPLTNDGEVLSQNFTTDFSIDVEGLTVRTIAGQIIIAQTRGAVTDTKARFTADTFRANFIAGFVIPEGWVRRTQNIKISEDHSKMDFTIVDAELPSDDAYPVGVSKIDFSQTVSARRPSFMTVSVEMNASVTVRKNYSMGLAFEKIILMMRERVGFMRATATLILLESFSITESPFTNQLSVSVGYRVGIRDLTNVVESTGLFKPWTVNNWQDWAIESAANAFSPRGLANMQDLLDSDVISDPCALINAQSVPIGPMARQKTVQNKRLTGDCFPYYLAYNPSTQFENKRRDIIHRRIIRTAPTRYTEDTYGNPQGQGQNPPTNDGSVDPQFTQYATPPDEDAYEVQPLSAGGENELVFSGVALRTSQPAVIPDLTNGWNGKEQDGKVVKTSSRIKHSIVGDIGGCPVYRTDWTIGYKSIKVESTKMSTSDGEDPTVVAKRGVQSENITEEP